MNDDPHELRRFVDAQDGVYARARDELAQGEKRTHWMWFVFPQLRGLGRSAMAQRYGIASEREALAYWEHPLLGPRLQDCTELVATIEGRTASEIFGAPDNLKFRSSMTLFAWTVPNEAVFRRALDKYFHGEPDPATIKLISRAATIR